MFANEDPGFLMDECEIGLKQQVEGQTALNAWLGGGLVYFYYGEPTKVSELEN